jgi:hypothetical protein
VGSWSPRECCRSDRLRRRRRWYCVCYAGCYIERRKGDEQGRTQGLFLENSLIDTPTLDLFGPSYGVTLQPCCRLAAVSNVRVQLGIDAHPPMETRRYAIPLRGNPY